VNCRAVSLGLEREEGERGRNGEGGTGEGKSRGVRGERIGKLVFPKLFQIGLNVKWPFLSCVRVVSTRSFGDGKHVQRGLCGKKPRCGEGRCGPTQSRKT
jgi:hypothetical protein